MRERRKLKRRHLMYYVRVYNATTGELIGNLVDITPIGAMVISKSRIPIDKKFRLRMELTADVADKPYMEFTAKSRWCQPDIDPNFYNTGFEMLDIAPQDVEIIQRIIDAHGFRDN